MDSRVDGDGAVGSVMIERLPWSWAGAWAVVAVLALQASAVAAGREWVVAQDGSGDFNGDTEAPIMAAIEQARSGGTVLVRRGVYTIWHTIPLDGANGLTLRGEEGTVLRLPRLPQTAVAEEAPPGSLELKVQDGSRFRAHTRVRIKAPGRTDMHHGKPVVIPTFEVTVAEVRGDVLELAEPLPYAAPAGAPIAFAENVFVLKSGKNITLDTLVVDGNKHETDPDFVGHVTLCPFLANGPYDYEKGLVGEPIRGLTLKNCTFRNTRGRCIAWYAVVESAIVDCVIEDSPDAGIDLDHFCYDIEVRGNTIRRCGIGVEINDGSRCTIRDNTIEGCERGVAIWRWCKHEDLNVDNVVADNVIRDSGTAAIHFRAATARNRATGNRLIGGKGAGILVEGDGNTVNSNRVEGFAQEGIRVTGVGNMVADNVCE